jgi:hypothetical protein
MVWSLAIAVRIDKIGRNEIARSAVDTFVVAERLFRATDGVVLSAQRFSRKQHTLVSTVILSDSRI